MPYSKFTLSKAVDDFQLTIIEGDRFLPEVSPVNASSLLKDTLKETLLKIADFPIRDRYDSCVTPKSNYAIEHISV